MKKLMFLFVVALCAFSMTYTVSVNDLKYFLEWETDYNTQKHYIFLWNHCSNYEKNVVSKVYIDELLSKKFSHESNVQWKLSEFFEIYKKSWEGRACLNKAFEGYVEEARALTDIHLDNLKTYLKKELLEKNYSDRLEKYTDNYEDYFNKRKFLDALFSEEFDFKDDENKNNETSKKTTLFDLFAQKKEEDFFKDEKISSLTTFLKKFCEREISENIEKNKEQKEPNKNSKNIKQLFDQLEESEVNTVSLSPASFKITLPGLFINFCLGATVKYANFSLPVRVMWFLIPTGSALVLDKHGIFGDPKKSLKKMMCMYGSYSLGIQGMSLLKNHRKSLLPSKML